MKSSLCPLFLILFATAAAVARAAPAAPPNVVFFLVDDMGWVDCGVYGSKYYQTPHIDRFAPARGKSQRWDFN